MTEVPPRSVPTELEFFATCRLREPSEPATSAVIVLTMLLRSTPAIGKGFKSRVPPGAVGPCTSRAVEDDPHVPAVVCTRKTSAVSGVPPAKPDPENLIAIFAAAVD